MKTLLANRGGLSKLSAGFCLLLLSPLVLFAQTTAKSPTADQFAGSYKGTAKDGAAAILLNLEIKSDNGKISGRLVAPKKEQAITSGEVIGGKLNLKLAAGDSVATLSLQPRDTKLIGDWKVGAQTFPVEFERVPAVTEPVAVKKTPEPSAAEQLTGEWEAAADAQGQTFPFTLVLKVDGEKVTGTSSSQLGESTISSGTWKDGKLAVILEGGSGQIALVGALVDGKLAGDYDYAGQLQGKWVAAKKKP